MKSILGFLLFSLVLNCCSENSDRLTERDSEAKIKMTLKNNSSFVDTWGFVGYLERDNIDLTKDLKAQDEAYIEVAAGDNSDIYKINGKSFVNLFISTVDLNEGAIEINNPIITTLALGKDEEMAKENLFREALLNAFIIEVDTNIMTIVSKDDKMIFVR